MPNRVLTKTETVAFGGGRSCRLAVVKNKVTVVEREGKTRINNALHFYTQHRVNVDAVSKSAEGMFSINRSYREAFVKSVNIRSKKGIGLVNGRNPSDSKFDKQTALQCLPEAFDTTFGLRGTSGNESYTKFFHSPPKLGIVNHFAGEVILYRKFASILG